MLMLMPPYHGALQLADEERIFEHFAAVAEAARIPIMVQDAPLSGVSLPVALLARLAREIPEVSHFKIETPMAANKLRALIEAGGADVTGPFDGEESIHAVGRSGRGRDRDHAERAVAGPYPASA